MEVRKSILTVPVLVGAAVVAACGGGTPAATRVDAAHLSTCRDAFQAWVDGSSAVNDANTDPVELFGAMQQVERRVFELCSLREAEQHNREMKVRDAPGVARSLIEPDMETFAISECVDDADLIGGTALCLEVAPEGLAT